MASLSSASTDGEVTRPQCPFDAIVVTSPNEHSAKVVSEELITIFEKSCSCSDVKSRPLLLAVHDPDGNRIGSGGGTINALDAAARALASQKFPNVNPIDVDISDAIVCAMESRILIIHSGGDSQRSPLQSVCGKAWCALSSAEPRNKQSPTSPPGVGIKDEHPTILLSPPRTPIEILIGTLCRMSCDLPVGSSVVACADVLLLVDHDVRLGFDGDSSHGRVCGLAIAADSELGPKHGCFTVDKKKAADCATIQRVVRYLQKAPKEELLNCDAIDEDSSTVLVDTGVIAFDGNASKSLLRLTTDVLSGSTLSAQKRALKQKSTPPAAVRTELYSDFLLAVSNVGGFDAQDESDGKVRFLESLNDGKGATLTNEVSIARGKVWDAMHGCSFSVAVPSSSKASSYFGHLGTTLEQIAMLRGEMSHFVKPFGIKNRVLVDITGFDNESEISLCKSDCVMINTRLQSDNQSNLPHVGRGAVIEHCDLKGIWAIGENSFVSGIRTLGSGCGVGSVLSNALRSAEGQCRSQCDFLNEVSEAVGEMNLVVPPGMCVQEVKLSSRSEFIEDDLFVTSLLGVSDKVKEVWSSESATICGVQWSVFFSLSGLKQADIWDENTPQTLWQAKLFPVYRASHESKSESIADDWRLSPCLIFWPLWLSLNVSPDVSVIKQWRSSERLSLKDILALSNPGAEFQWRHHLEQVIGQSIVSKAIPKYISPAVTTAVKFAERDIASLIKPTVNGRVVVESPARIDLSGGWTDTPPICYEMGGSVVNLAVSIDDKSPIIVTAQVSEHIESSPPLVLSTVANVDIEVWELREMMDFDTPTAPGALLKATLVVSGLVDTSKPQSLRDQLYSSLGGNLRLESRSFLPVGSGMGTSSILAGALLTALGHVSNRIYSDIQLVHAVLLVEQALTTGGGWQDQVGGCYPGGAKWAKSNPSLPLQVFVDCLKMPENTTQQLSHNLALIFTGRSRLAKNVLVEVIRRWWLENDGDLVIKTAKDLLVQAEICASALERGDIAAVGSCLSKYHALKCNMAGDEYEPDEVKEIMKVLQPLSHGMSLCGAGGGGFLVVLTKEPFKEGTSCWQAIHDAAESVGGTAHSAHLVESGMKVTVHEQ